MVLLALNDGLSGQVGVSVGVILVGTLVLVELGLLLGGIFEDVASLNTWSSILSLVLMLPGMLASFLSSGVFKLGLLGTVMRLFPTYYVLDAVNLSIVGRATPSALAVDVLVLSGLAVGLFVTVIRSLQRREQ
jgi:ABC-type Na+ efflux pump permease subunit